MFCKSCGAEIQDGAEFCPKCGKRTLGAIASPTGNIPSGSSFSLPSIGSQGQQPKQAASRKAGGNAPSKKVIVLAAAFIVVAAVILAGAMALRRGGSKKDYSVVGVWQSNDSNLSQLEDCIVGLMVTEGGCPETIAYMIMDELGLGWLDEITLTLTESGRIYIGARDVSVGVGTITYEDMGNGRLLLSFTADVSVFGTGTSVTVSYNAKYSVDKDSMTLDLFGCKLDFDRQ